MTNAVQHESQPLNRGRPTKFTPERIQQISNLVERGKSRDEIAGIIGVTTGTLQVTCSKLGISLRRPHRHWAPYQRTESPKSIELTVEKYEAGNCQWTSARLRGKTNRRCAGWSAIRRLSG